MPIFDTQETKPPPNMAAVDSVIPVGFDGEGVGKNVKVKVKELNNGGSKNNLNSKESSKAKPKLRTTSFSKAASTPVIKKFQKLIPSPRYGLATLLSRSNSTESIGKKSRLYSLNSKRKSRSEIKLDLNSNDYKGAEKVLPLSKKESETSENVFKQNEMAKIIYCLTLNTNSNIFDFLQLFFKKAKELIKSEDAMLVLINPEIAKQTVTSTEGKTSSLPYEGSFDEYLDSIQYNTCFICNENIEKSVHIKFLESYYSNRKLSKLRNLLGVKTRNSEGKYVGVIYFMNSLQEETFSEEERQKLEFLSNSVSALICRFKDEEELRTSKKKSESLLRLTRCIHKGDGDNLNMLPRLLIEVIKTCIKCKNITFYFTCEEEKLIWSAICSGKVGQIFIPYGQGLAGWVAQTGKTSNIQNAYKDKRFSDTVDKITKEVTRTILTVPVKYKGRTLAILQLLNKCEDTETKNAEVRLNDYFTESDQDIAESLCEEIGVYFYKNRHQIQYSKVALNMRKMHLGGEQGDHDGVKILKSLLTTHTSVLPANEEVVDNFQYFRSVGKFRRRLKSMRMESESEETAKMKNNLLKFNAKEKGETEGKISDVVPKWETWRSNLACIIAEYKECEIKEKLAIYRFHQFHFDVFTVDLHFLGTLVVQSFHTLNLIDYFRINEKTLFEFVRTIQSNYSPLNPYHNWFHAVATMQQVFTILLETKCSEFMNYVDVLGIIVSAFCHDVGHTGVTNDFECNTFGRLAMLYNDVSVLEHHHAATTFKVLQLESCNIFQGLSKPMYRKVRKIIIGNILSTDMKYHHEQLTAFEERAFRQRATENEVIFDRFNQEDVSKLTNFLLHTCDIGAQTYPTDMAREWGERILLEFERQSKHEIANKIPVTEHMVGLSDTNKRAKLQLNFTRYIVEPAWTKLSLLFPELEFIIVNIKQNKCSYEKAIKESKLEKTS